MPPRFAYWTIILGGTATSFRAREQAELVPTFNRLKQKDPTAHMKWFSGGTLWDSPEQAKEQRRLERDRQYNDSRPGAERPRAGRVLHSRTEGNRSQNRRPGGDWPRTERPAPADVPVATIAPRTPRMLPRLPSPESPAKLPPGKARKAAKH